MTLITLEVILQNPMIHYFMKFTFKTAHATTKTTTTKNHVPLHKFILKYSNKIQPLCLQHHKQTLCTQWLTSFARDRILITASVLTCLLSAWSGGGGGRAQSRYNILNRSHCISTTTSLSPVNNKPNQVMRFQAKLVTSSPTIPHL